MGNLFKKLFITLCLKPRNLYHCTLQTKKFVPFTWANISASLNEGNWTEAKLMQSEYIVLFVLFYHIYEHNLTK